MCLLLLQGIRNGIGDRSTPRSKTAHFRESFKGKEGGGKKIGNNKYSNLLEMTDEIRRLFKEKFPNLRESIITRLLTCPNCYKKVCRDVNGAFNILTNFLDSIYNGSLGLTTLKYLKKEKEP